MRSETFLLGDCRETLKGIDDGIVQTCITSPPYFGLRDYGHGDQIGLEETPEAFVAGLVDVFREVKRVLRDDGTLWLNLGDSYASSGRSSRKESPGVGAKQEMKAPGRSLVWEAGGGHNFSWFIPSFGMKIKPKDLCGIPWRMAFALQADGWYLRQDIIWHKPNPMPESVQDRCTKAHEYIFLLSKSSKYYYDHEAIKDPVKQDWGTRDRTDGKYHNEGSGLQPHGGLEKSYETANKRSVWTVTTKPYKGAHFATFPPKLITPCVLAGSRPGDIVLDPFTGAGTTALVAKENSRRFIGCELNPEYLEIAKNRIANATPGLGI